MAYEGGGLLQFLKPDLTTRLGAQSAMDSAKFCFLIVAAFRVVAFALLLSTSGASLSALPPEALGEVIGELLFWLVPPLLAAWRLHVYKGAYAVPAATALFVLGILAFPSLAGIVIGALFTAVFIGGIRGAWALRRDAPFEDDNYATFG